MSSADRGQTPSGFGAESCRAWWREIRAVLRKEWLCEGRSLTGFATTLAFAFVSVVVLTNATYGMKVSPVLGAGLIWIVLVLGSGVTLVRTFLAEAESGTLDTLVLVSRPEAIYWGKTLINSAQVIVAAVPSLILLCAQIGSRIMMPYWFFHSIFFGCVSIASSLTICSAIACKSQNRSALAATLSVAALIFLANLGVSALSGALGEGHGETVQHAMALCAYAVLVSVGGSLLYGKVYRE